MHTNNYSILIQHKGHWDALGFIVHDYGERIDNIRICNDGLNTIFTLKITFKKIKCCLSGVV
ncbi:hypothetical protein H5410_030421 [Solanum commersonii]|uniref:Uncharacterized protein n=1 Tax=Solanum commersonii TaxID=4109 RepID=A0A9J5YE91_SOLCO|nr:hypothetical protein H5410_030421 [Solanum commersonii]